MVGYVYRITNTQTGKVYIGITEDFIRRQKKHIYELRKGIHHSPKLQNAWNFYGEDNFEWTFREVEITKYDDLYDIEIKEIEKFDSYNNGYNCNRGGRISDWRQKVLNEDIVKFLCIQWKYGDGYGKTFEEIFNWAKGTASAVKRKNRYVDANIAFEKLTKEERDKIAIKTFESLELDKKALNRQLTQGGCKRAYQLNQGDFNLAFSAQEMGYSYSVVAAHLGIKPATVKDWFSGRSRKKEKEKYDALSQKEKQVFKAKVREANLIQYSHDKLASKKEEDVIAFLCYDKFYNQNDTSIQRFFQWPEGTCYNMRKKNFYPISKQKVELLSLERQKQIADTLNSSISRPY